jgi:hypothetical protein
MKLLIMTEVVISKYNENCEWIEKIKHKTIIYDKSESPINGSIVRPNIGREAETLLYHIIENYDKLPDITIFLQGDPRSNPVKYTYEEVIEEVNKDHEKKLKTILTWEGVVDIRNYWLKSCSILNDTLFESDSYMVTYSSGAQYVIPIDCIINRPVSFYKMLHEQVIKYQNKPLVWDKKDLSEGVDAWTMELLWGSIFNVNKILKNNYGVLS